MRVGQDDRQRRAAARTLGIDRLVERGEQRERGQRGRADGEALADRRGGVAQRVEPSVILRTSGSEAGHLRDAAGVVGDRAVGVDRHRDRRPWPACRRRRCRCRRGRRRSRRSRCATQISSTGTAVDSMPDREARDDVRRRARSCYASAMRRDGTRRRVVLGDQADRRSPTTRAAQHRPERHRVRHVVGRGSDSQRPPRNRPVAMNVELRSADAASSACSTCIDRMPDDRGDEPDPREHDGSASSDRRQVRGR